MIRNLLIKLAVLTLQYFSTTNHVAILTKREMQVYERLYIDSQCGWFLSFALEIPPAKPDLLTRTYLRFKNGKS